MTDAPASLASQPGPSSPTFTIGIDGDKEAFLKRLMEAEEGTPFCRVTCDKDACQDAASDELMDDEYYIFSAECCNDEYMDINAPTGDAPVSDVIDPFDFVYSNIPDRTHSLKQGDDCRHCKTKNFEYETKGFCCRGGKRELTNAVPDPDPELMTLWSSADADSRHFLNSIRFFNGHFSFTTLSVSLDNKYTNMTSGVYTFWAHGTMYHNVHFRGWVEARTSTTLLLR